MYITSHKIDSIKHVMALPKAESTDLPTFSGSAPRPAFKPYSSHLKAIHLPSRRISNGSQHRVLNFSRSSSKELLHTINRGEYLKFLKIILIKTFIWENYYI